MMEIATLVGGIGIFLLGMTLLTDRYAQKMGGYAVTTSIESVHRRLFIWSGTRRDADGPVSIFFGDDTDDDWVCECGAPDIHAIVTSRHWSQCRECDDGMDHCHPRL